MGWRDRAETVTPGKSDWRSRAEPVSAPSPLASVESIGPRTDTVRELDGPMGKVRSAARNIVPGADYVAAGAEWLGDKFDDKPDLPFDEHLKQQRALNQASEEENPATGFAGQAALAAATPWSKAPGVVGALTRAGQQGLTSGVFAAGKSDAEGVTGKLTDAASAAAVTAPLAFGGETAAAGLKAIGRTIPRALRAEDESGALRAVGATGGDFRQIRNTPTGKAEIAAISRDLHDEGIIRAGATADEMETALNAAKANWGQRVGVVYSELDNLGAYGDMSAVEQAALKVKGEFARMAGADNSGRAARIQSELDHLLGNAAQGRTIIPLTELHTWRTQVDDLIYKYAPSQDPSASLTKSTLMEFRQVLQGELDEAAGRALQLHQRNDLAAALAVGNRKYRSIATAREWANDAAAKAEGTKIVPALAGAAGVASAGSFATGHEASGIGFGASAIGALMLRKGVEPRLASTLSAGAHRILNPGSARGFVHDKVLAPAGAGISTLAGAGMRAGAIEAGESQTTPMTQDEKFQAIQGWLKRNAAP
jgi:hypothetical protein